MIEQFNKASGGNVPLNGQPAVPSRADQIRALAKKATPVEPVKAPTVGEDATNTINNAGAKVNADIQGTSPESQGEGGLVRGLQAAKEAGSGVLDLVGTLVKHLAGDKTNFSGSTDKPTLDKSGTDVKIQNTGPSPAFVDAVNNFTQSHPDAAKHLDSVLKGIGATGSIAGDVAIADLGVTGAEKTGAEAAQGIKDTSKVLPKAASVTKPDNFIDELITPKMTQKSTETAIKTGRVSENSKITGERDYTDAVPGFNKIKESVSKVPGLSNKNTLLENSNLIHDAIGKTAEDLKSQLKGKGSFTPAEFNKYMGGIKKTLSENPMIVGDAEKTASKIVSKFNSLVAENGYKPEGLLEARKQLDTWMASQKGNVFNPSTESAISTALRSIRQGGNKFLADLPGVKGKVDVEGLLGHQSNLYDAIENIAPKAAKEGSNVLQRFVKNNPMTAKALKYTATAAGGGLVAKEIFK